MYPHPVSKLRKFRRQLTGLLLLSMAAPIRGLVRPLPRQLVAWIGVSCGWLAQFLLPGDRRRTRVQLERLPRDRRPSVSAVFTHLGRCAADVCTLPTDPAKLDRMVRTDGWELMEQRAAGGLGTVWVSGHVGNWEIPPAWVASRGIPVYVIAAPVHYPVLDRWVTRMRAFHGVQVLKPTRRDLRTAVRLLRAGAQLAVLIDQSIPGRGTWVPFLGSPAWTPTGAARLARDAGVPVALGRCHREPDGHYHVRFGPLMHGHDPIQLTAQLTAGIEEMVRDHPEQWVWMHDRWRAPA